MVLDIIGFAVIATLIYLGGRWVLDNVEIKKKKD